MVQFIAHCFAGKEGIVTKKEYYDFREEENTRQVNLFLLVRNALKGWKLILLAGVILGCLFGGYKILSIHSNKEAMIEDYDTYAAKRDAYKKSIQEYKQSVADLQNRIDKRIEYVQNSPKMQLNAHNAPSASCEIKLSNVKDGKLKSEDFTMIKTAIANELLFGDSLSPLAEKYGVSLVNLREMFMVKTPSVGSTMRIVVHNDTLESSEKLREDIIKVIESKHNDFAKAIGNYKMEVFNKSTEYAMDSDVITYQDKQNEALSKLQTESYTAQNQSTQLVKPTSVQQYSKKYMLISGIKMGVIGLIGGCILAIAALMFLMIQKGVIFAAEEIDGEYGLRKLADFSEGGNNEPGNTIDYIIARLENCAGGRKEMKVGVTGLADAARLEAMTGDLNKAAGTSANPIRFAFLPDLIGNAASLRNLRNVDGVILVEEIGKSEFMKVRQEIALIADSEREILGTVYF